MHYRRHRYQRQSFVGHAEFPYHVPGHAAEWRVSHQYQKLHVVLVCGDAGDIVSVRYGIYFGCILKPVSNQAVRDVLRKSKL